MDRQIKIIVIILLVNFAVFPAFSGYFAYYVPSTHEITLSERGIVGNATWGAVVYKYVNGTGIRVGSYETANGTIPLSLDYGYYSYIPVVPDGYKGPTHRFDFALSRSSVPGIKIISFHKLYPLSFSQTGLSRGYNWSVSVKGYGSENTTATSGSPLIFHAPAGNYSCRITASGATGSARSMAPSINGVVNKDGYTMVSLGESAKNVTISFTDNAYPVTFQVISNTKLSTRTLKGLPVTMDGSLQYSVYNSSTGSYSPVTFMLPNGTFQYATLNMTGFSEQNQWGYVTVNGKSVSVALVYKFNQGF